MKLAILFCAVTSVASAQPAPETPTPAPEPDKRADGKALTKVDTKRIEQLFDEGTKHYDLGEWDKAIGSFKEAYALFPDPSFLFNLGQAYKQKGACRDATAAYVAYLRKAPNEDRAKVEGFIHELEPCQKLEEEAARRAAPPRRERIWPRTVRWTGYATVGVGGVLVGIGALFARRSHNAERDFEQACTDSCAAGSELDGLEQRGRDAVRSSKRFYIAGGSALAIGGALVVIGFRTREWVVVTPVANGAVASVGAKF